MTIKVDWETDGENVDLPEIVEIDLANFFQGREHEQHDREQVNSQICAFLSDKYGWLVNGFDIIKA